MWFTCRYIIGVWPIFNDLALLLPVDQESGSQGGNFTIAYFAALTEMVDLSLFVCCMDKHKSSSLYHQPYMIAAYVLIVVQLVGKYLLFFFCKLANVPKFCILYMYH